MMFIIFNNQRTDFESDDMRENYTSLSSKKLQDLSNQVLYAKMFLILGILWMFSMTHYILHR